MSQCLHGERVRREGVSKKNGKPYVAHFCPAPKGSPDQCPPEFEKDAPAGRAGAAQRFSQESASADYQNGQKAKDDKISKLALCKSAIEAGLSYGPDTVKELEKWLAWAEGRTTTVKPPADANDTENIPW